TQPRARVHARRRDDVCGKVLEFQSALRDRPLTQQEAADELGVARTTLLGWRDRIARTDLTPAQRAFFESPDGVQFLHVLRLAALFVMNQCGGLGVAMVRAFFTLARLDGLLACSDTTLLRTRRAMIEATGTWGDAQDAILARTMAPKDILVGADENFHDAMMLVAMEPVSGFVLVEQGADRRDGETWTKTLRGALAKWPVRLVALVGDEAKGLLHCAMTGLGVPKVSDVFHVLHTLCGGTAGALAQQVRGAQTALDTARAELDVADAVRTATAARSESELYQRLGGMLRAFDKVTAAHKTLALVEASCEAVRAAVRDLSDRYHPVDLVTGALLSPTAVAARLREGFTTLRTRVREAGVATHTRVAKALTKAERVLPS